MTATHGLRGTSYFAPRSARSGRTLRSRPLDETRLRELFATPPSEFVAARNELVKALRRDKQREEAATVAALRRPGWDDWALNAVATERAGDVDAFAAAAAAVRDAQAAAIEGRSGPDVRASLRELRECTAGLVRLAGDVLSRAGREGGEGELTARLSEVAGTQPAVDQLRAGVLGSGTAAPDDLFGDLRPAPRAKRPAQQPATQQPAKRSGARATSAARPTSPQPEAAERASTRADDKRRREALGTATRAERAATKALARAEAKVKSARDAVRQAAAALAAAETARDAASDELARAGTDLERARSDPANA